MLLDKTMTGHRSAKAPNKLIEPIEATMTNPSNRNDDATAASECEEDNQPLLQRLGPGLITGAADDDPSGIATYSQACPGRCKSEPPYRPNSEPGMEAAGESLRAVDEFSLGG